ncbi:MAG: restriction endonuclease [Oscillospiraceae bacterium]|nr:restriction endonuclease [Oscillospiraceae bacterium]
MGTIYDALDFIRSSATSEKDKGTKFERLCRFFLKNDPLWKARFSDVWMWANAPTNDGADIGIDLVARDREDGTYWAIQCKCLDDGATLEYKPVGTFYGKAGVDGTYPHTMLITTADRLSSHLETVADSWKTVRIYTDDMAQSEIDYADWIEGRATTTRVLKRPREHQSEAIRACLNKFRTYDRGKLIMACGTGKNNHGAPPDRSAAA